MACSRFEYVKRFEHDPPLLPCTWAVIRLDGRSFSSFSERHHFHKPNDARALNLSNAAATSVLQSFSGHLLCAFGQSDEFSFVLKRQSALFGRRTAKILSTVVSLFSAAYVRYWPQFMEGIDMLELPSFDGRIVLYPTTKHLRDYLAWRQADVHVNNLFNTVFWALINEAGYNMQEAEGFLKGTLSKHKHEVLFSQFGINYNNEPSIFRKGSFVVKRALLGMSEVREGEGVKRRKLGEEGLVDTGVDGARGGGDDDSQFVVLHDDIIGDLFWEQNPRLLAPSDLDPPRVPKLR